VIRSAQAEDIPEVRTLFQEYADSLGVDLCFQNFARELAELPGNYETILLVPNAACVALRPLSPEIGEMKRLYVRPQYRGQGLGRQLTEAIISQARVKGYRSLRLDTLPQLQTAIAMYRRLGFREIDPYNSNPVPGVLFMELTL